IEAQGQMIQSYKDALKQTQQEFQELIKDADLTKQLEIQTLKSEGERKIEELQTVLKEVQLDLDKEKSNHQVSTDETKHINQQRIRELEDKLKETKEKLLSNQAQIEMLEREKSLPKSHSVQLHNTFLMSELEASERKVKTQAALISALEDSAKKITEEYDQTLTKIKAWLLMAAPGQCPEGLPRKAVDLCQGLCIGVNGKELDPPLHSTPLHSRHSLSDALQVVFVPRRSGGCTLTWREDRLTMEQLKLEEQYKIQGLQETLEKAHKQLEEQTSLPKSRSIIERNNALKAALDSRNAQIDAQNEIIDALRNTIQKIKHDYGEIINKAQQEIKVSSEAKEKEFEQRINELNRELTFANEKMNTYQAQIQAFEEK
ncbi:unnamed protein product, partial [Timema podura]|nr:unnamed protein product [Timema podura]